MFGYRWSSKYKIMNIITLTKLRWWVPDIWFTCKNDILVQLNWHYLIHLFTQSMLVLFPDAATKLRIFATYFLQLLLRPTLRLKAGLFIMPNKIMNRGIVHIWCSTNSWWLLIIKQFSKNVQNILNLTLRDRKYYRKIQLQTSPLRAWH